MVYVFLAHGFEETEAIATIDVLRRAGLDVVTAGVGGRIITGSHSIPVTADIEAENIKYDKIEAVVLPGGQPGTENLYGSESVRSALRYCFDNSLTVCAICAAPTVLGRLGYLEGKNAVCYPGCEGQLYGACYDADAGVCVDGGIITGKGPGRTVDFALTIVERLKGEKAAQRVRSSMQCK